MYGHHAHAHVLRLLYRYLHRLGRYDYAQTPVGVYVGGGRSLARNPPVRIIIYLAAAVPGDVRAQHIRNAMRLHAAHIGDDENVGGEFAVRVVDAHLLENTCNRLPKSVLLYMDSYILRHLELF